MVPVDWEMNSVITIASLRAMSGDRQTLVVFGHHGSWPAGIAGGDF